MQFRRTACIGITFLVFGALGLFSKYPSFNGLQTSHQGFDIKVSEKVHYLQSTSIKDRDEDFSFTSLSSRTRLDYDYALEDGVFGYYMFWDCARNMTADRTQTFKGRFTSQEIGLGITLDQLKGDQWGIFAKAAIGWARIARNGVSSTYMRGKHYYLAGGFRYDMTDDLTFRLGVNYWSRLQRSNVLLPFVGVDWQCCKRLSVRLTQDIESASLSSRFDMFNNEVIFLDASFKYLFRQYALFNSDTTGKRALHDTAYIAEIGAETHVGETVYFRPYFQVAFGRKLDAYAGDSKDSAFASRSLKTSYGGGLELAMIF